MCYTLVLHSMERRQIIWPREKNGWEIEGISGGGQEHGEFTVGYGETTAGSEAPKCLGIPLSEGGRAAIMWES